MRQVQKPRKTGPQKRHHDDSHEQKEHIPFKKQRLTTEELENTIKDKIQKSKESIAKLKNHIESNTCPKTGQYKRRTADYGLRTGYKIRTRYETRTGKYGLGIKHGLGIKRGLENTDWV